MAVNSMGSSIRQVFLLIFDSNRTVLISLLWSPHFTINTHPHLISLPTLLSSLHLLPHQLMYDILLFPSPKPTKMVDRDCDLFCLLLFLLFLQEFWHIKILCVESRIPPPLLTSYVFLGNLLTFSKPQFLQFKNEDINNNYNILFY